MFAALLLSALCCSPALASKLVKRFSGDATYYDVGLGACGQNSSPNEYVVALNHEQFDDSGVVYPGPHCFQTVTIHYNGKSATATIVDKCPGCAYGSLDLSTSLFNYLENPDKGRFQMSWDYGGGGSGPAADPPTNPQPNPVPTPAPQSESPVHSTAPPDSTPKPSATQSTTQQVQVQSKTSSSTASSASSTAHSNTTITSPWLQEGNIMGINMMGLIMDSLIPQAAFGT